MQEAGNFREISEISTIQVNNNICIDPKPRYRICGNFGNFKEISEISTIQLNNDTYIDPKPRHRICGNFGNFKEISEISGKFQKFQLYKLIIIYVSILGVGVESVEILVISRKFQ